MSDEETRDREPSDQAWRGVIAALANPRQRRMLAEVITTDDPALTPGERRDARLILQKSGLLTAGGQLDERFLRSLLATGRPDEVMGIDRYLRSDGRIDRYPSTAAHRLELFTWVAERLLGSDEVLSEKELTERLFPFTTDPNTLRRALVDAELLDRNLDGTDYRRGTPGDAVDEDDAVGGSS